MQIGKINHRRQSQKQMKGKRTFPMSEWFSGKWHTWLDCLLVSLMKMLAPLLLFFDLSSCFPLMRLIFFTSFTEQNLMVFCSSCSARNFLVSMVRSLRFPYLGRQAGLFSSLLMTAVVCKLAVFWIVQLPIRCGLGYYDLWCLIWKLPELFLLLSTISPPLCLTVENKFILYFYSIIFLCPMFSNWSRPTSSQLVFYPVGSLF